MHSSAFFLLASSFFTLLPLLHAQDTMDLLEFDPPVFKLAEDRTSPSILKVRLRQLPKYPTTLYFESPNLRFSQCALSFSPRTYSDWHTIDIRALPYFTDADRGRHEVISMRMACPKYGGWHGRNWTVQVDRPSVKGATCSSTGDPHITTFDGKYYSYQGLGCFYLLKSDALTVQTTTDKWDGSTTVSVATAIRYGRAHFIVDARETDPGRRLVQLSDTSDGVDVVISANREEFRFKFSDGSAVTITYHKGSPRAYLDHQIDVPACARGKTLGLCGTFNGNQADDWTAADGTVKTDMNQCADTWRVPATDDIFVCKDRCPDAAAARVIKSCDQCRIPVNLDGEGIYRDRDPSYVAWDGHRGSYNIPKPVYDTSKPHLTPVVSVDPDFRKRAQAACDAAFNIPDLHKIVATTPYKKACVSDCELTKSLAMVDAKKSAYLNRVYSSVNPVLAAAAYRPEKHDTAIVATCKKAAAQLGLGQKRCPNDCSGHGKCQKCGCKCNPGWSGVACAVRLDAYGIPVVKGGRQAQLSVYGPPKYDDRDVVRGNVNSRFGGSGRKNMHTMEEDLEEDVREDMTPAPVNPFSRIPQRNTDDMFNVANRIPVGARAEVPDIAMFGDEEEDMTREEQDEA